MTYERDMIAALLKLTDAGPVAEETLRKHTRLNAAILNRALARLSDSGLVRLKRGLVEVSSGQRVKLAFRAVMLGGDLERTCRYLRWSEFEAVAAEALEINGFKVARNLHFKNKGKRWEMDVIGFDEPLIVCIDCKHWRRRLNQSGLVKAVEAQVERTEAFGEILHDYWMKSGLSEWKTATLVPLVLSLVSGSQRFHNNVPIVSIMQLQDFINTLPFEAHKLTHFNKLSLKPEQKLSDYCKK